MIDDFVCTITTISQVLPIKDLSLTLRRFHRRGSNKLLTSFTMLYVIGLGLADENDITLKGLDAVRSCSRIYLDAYTSILGVDKDKLVWI